MYYIVIYTMIEMPNQRGKGERGRLGEKNERQIQ